MLKKVKKVYEGMLFDMLSTANGGMNDEIGRKKIKDKLKSELGNVTVVCNERLNPPAVKHNQCLIAKVSWIESKKKKTAKLVFGTQESIDRLNELKLI